MVKSFFIRKILVHTKKSRKIQKIRKKSEKIQKNSEKNKKSEKNPKNLKNIYLGDFSVVKSFVIHKILVHTKNLEKSKKSEKNPKKSEISEKYKKYLFGSEQPLDLN